MKLGLFDTSTESNQGDGNLKGREEEKKIKGRSPVPLDSNIKEPHTDNNPFSKLVHQITIPITVSLSSLRNYLNFPEGWGFGNIL